MPRRRRAPIVRQPLSSPDPVGAVLANASAVTSRYPGEQLDLEDLRTIIGVSELDPSRYDGFNTSIGFMDECSSYAPMEDGVELILAEQPGIRRLEHPDREEMVVRTTLALPDVHAAAVRALLEANRRPRSLPPIGLAPSVLSDLAQHLAGALAWPGRLRMTRETDEPGHLAGWHGSYRVSEPRLVQVVHLGKGLGRHSDGTNLDGTVALRLAVIDISAETAEESIRDSGVGREFPRGTVVAERNVRAVPPTGEAVVRATADALPWFDTVATRQSIVDVWVDDPGGLAPYPLWEKVEVAARWGQDDAARALLRIGHQEQPQHGPKFDAVAQRYGL